jgi:hypothetical protein
MSTLASFRAALLDAGAPIPQGLTDAQGRPAGRRYAVYRNNVAVSLTEALETGFPALRSLIGEERFRQLAGMYLRSEQPETPMLMQYGAGLPAFLEGFAPLAQIPYLADVARLELALRRSYHAADHVALDGSALSALGDDLMQARLTFAPSAQLIASPWPVIDIRRYALDQSAAKPAAEAQTALILRPEFDPEIHALTEDAARFVSGLMAGTTFGDALTQAGDAFDLGPTLSLLLTQGALTAIAPGKDTPCTD